MSCEKITLENMSVKKYIKLLKSGSYDFIDLPPFDSKDIPELLKYVDDTQIIKNFPINLSSSLHVPECELGIYTLWTIESIRVCSIVADAHPFRFPSATPLLRFKIADSGVVDNEIAHPAASEAYKDWWNSNNDFQLIKNTNPLENTEYKW
jgi:hypothetical protein